MTEHRIRELDIAWVQNMINSLNEGGVWAIPMNNSAWKFYESKKTAELLYGDPTAPQNIITQTILEEHLNWETKTNGK